jgi:hypothetical protein
MTDHDNAIRAVLNLYALAVDTQRWDLFDRIFVPDADSDYGGTAHWRDLETLKRDFAVFHDPFEATQHTMTNQLVSVDGNHACSLTYGHWRLIRPMPTGGNMWEGTGWYDDRLARTPDGWRITHRTCRVMWWAGNGHVRETIPGMTFEQDLASLRRDADAGRLSYLKVIADR